MIEFGFLAPALFTIVLGIVEVGRMFYVRQSLEYATETAARYYMVNPAANFADVKATLRAAMAGGMGPDIVIVDPPISTTNCNSNAAVTCTTITATYTFVSVASFLNLGNPQLQAQAKVVRVQQ